MMKRFLPKQKLSLVTAVYWFLLLYIIVALVWWFISLMQQSRQMSNYKLMELKADDPNYLVKVNFITEQERRAAAQYVSEGIVFLVVIIICAVFVYRAVRKQFKLAEQQRNFMMAVTHELKTPIAVAKLNLETLLKHKLDEARQQKLILMTLQETNRLNALANNILISAQLEEGAYMIAREDIDFSALVAKCVHDYQARFPERRWSVDIEEDVAVEGDTLLLQILVNNLLDNAIKYSPKEGLITVILRNNNTVRLSVIDDGRGIPDDEKQRIFDRFYRIGNESVRKTQGTGLGLYLCKKIAADHNAYISVTDNSPVGTNFTIHFHV